MHFLRVLLCSDSFEGAFGIELPELNMILVSNIDKVLVLDNANYVIQSKLPVTLLQT